MIYRDINMYIKSKVKKKVLLAAIIIIVRLKKAHN